MNRSDDVSSPHNVTTSTESMVITGTATDAAKESTVDVNPWAEQSEMDPLKDHHVLTPDPNALAAEMEPTQGFEAALPKSDSTLHIKDDVLGQFDPLAVKEEKDAMDAWSQAESHPPPASPISTTIPAGHSETNVEKPVPDVPASPARPSTFPSLTSLARSLSLSRQRPRSIDSPPNVLSPASLSSFASLQRTQPITDGYKPEETAGSASPRPAKDREDDKPPPFDFQKFLDQMKLKSAEPVAKYLRSFLSNFAKRTLTVNDQVRVINEFLNFISGHMREVDVWRNASDVEFDNAMEAMEKLIMNRLYEFTFTPQISYVIPPRPITTDDLERDRVLAQRIALFGWIKEKHLDVPEGEGSKGFLDFAQQELLKINHYKAPRDKLICILNCCKVIFGLIRHTQREEGADSFVPILIFVVLKANPPHLLSNVEYINRFRNPQKLQSEAGYYLSSLMGAVSFIETMDHSSLSSITSEEFENNVEEAIQFLPDSPLPLANTIPSRPSTPSSAPLPPTSPHAGEESAQPLSLPAPGQSMSLVDDTRRFFQKTGDTISKPLNALGRIFNEALDGAEDKLTYMPGPFAPFEMGREMRQERDAEQKAHWAHPDQVRRYAEEGPSMPQTPLGSEGGGYDPTMQTPYKPRVRPFANSPPSAQSTRSFGDGTPTRGRPYTQQPLSLGTSSLAQAPAIPPRLQQPSPHPSRTPTPNLDLTGLQAEIDHAHEAAAAAALGTLVQIFPGTDREVIEWVLEANEGDLGRSIEALLEVGGTEGN